MSEYIHKNGLVYKNQFHVIWCPKYRRPVLVNEVRKRLIDVLFEVAKEMDVDIKSLEVMPDHVHIFMEFDPRIMLHFVVKHMKGRSARILRSEFPFLKSKLPSLWTKSYFSCSVGHISEKTIKQYIESQYKSQWAEGRDKLEK